MGTGAPCRRGMGHSMSQCLDSPTAPAAANREDVSRLFWHWYRMCARQRTRDSAHRAEEASLRASQYLSQMQDQEATFERAARLIARSEVSPLEADDAVCCAVCFEGQLPRSVRCDAGHDACHACVDKYCRLLVASMEASPASLSIECPGMGCNARIPARELAATQGGLALRDEFVHAQACATAAATFTRCEARHAHMRLRYLRRDDTFRAYQCPSCKYGPIEHFSCNDLREHHMRLGCNNGCPRCNHLCTHSNELELWDGSACDGS